MSFSEINLLVFFGINPSELRGISNEDIESMAYFFLKAKTKKEMIEEIKKELAIVQRGLKRVSENAQPLEN